VATGVLVALWGVGAILYFIPWIVAAQRGVRDQAGIIIVNLLLGWTILGRVGALVWAVSAKTVEHHRETVQQGGEAPTADHWVKPGSPAVADTVVQALPVAGGRSESDSVWL
jgi:Superinfection immunity protein